MISADDIEAMREDAFDAWLSEIENFSTRKERLYEDFHDLSNKKMDTLMLWLRASYEIGKQ